MTSYELGSTNLGRNCKFVTDHFNGDHSEENKVFNKEADELLAITVQSIKTSGANQESNKKN